MAEKDVLYHELLEALQAEGCAVCRLARGASDSYIHALIYEGVTDVKLRETLRDAAGPVLPARLAPGGQRGAVLGTAIIYRDVVNTLIKALEANADAPTRLFGRGQPDLSRAPRAVSRRARPASSSATRSSATVKVLLSHIERRGHLAEAYKQAGGICLPHFQLALSQAGQAAVRLLAGVAGRRVVATARRAGRADPQARLPLSLGDRSPTPKRTRGSGRLRRSSGEAGAATERSLAAFVTLDTRRFDTSRRQEYTPRVLLYTGSRSLTGCSRPDRLISSSTFRSPLEETYDRIHSLRAGDHAR